MASSADSHRSIALERESRGRFRATNRRGGELSLGGGEDADFTPVELLLAAIGGCSAIDVDLITSKRQEAESFRLDVAAEKVRDEHGNHLTDITLTFRVSFGAGAAGDAARAVLPDAVQRSHDRLCTVSRTVELPTPVAVHVA